MPSVIQEIPLSPARRGRYSEIMELLRQNPTKWVKLEPEEVQGDNGQRRQISLHQAAKLRGLKIETQTRGDLIYVRLRFMEEPPCEDVEERRSRASEVAALRDVAGRLGVQIECMPRDTDLNRTRRRMLAQCVEDLYTIISVRAQYPTPLPEPKPQVAAYDLSEFFVYGDPAVDRNTEQANG